MAWFCSVEIGSAMVVGLVWVFCVVGLWWSVVVLVYWVYDFFFGGGFTSGGGGGGGGGGDGFAVVEVAMVFGRISVYLRKRV